MMKEPTGDLPRSSEDAPLVDTLGERAWKIVSRVLPWCAALAILALVVSVVRRDDARPLQAIDYVLRCQPGGSIYRCHKGLADASSGVFPHLDLVSMDVGLERVEEPRRRLFRYRMTFRRAEDANDRAYKREQIIELLQQELGTANRRGIPPLRAPLVGGGDYWLTAEGVWLCSGTAVTWYGAPIEMHGRTPYPDEWDEEIDAYVRPAPQAARVWRHLGQFLATDR